ncbi:hypothetical protein HMPREF1551_02400 [Capnocytophaga sp. oral taxon 863 str. F0517]|nr:hypothetical protein HMPREF1551_02400 [Capnocytophaga sp. oral taxon 863 str. F0517]
MHISPLNRIGTYFLFQKEILEKIIVGNVLRIAAVATRRLP